MEEHKELMGFAAFTDQILHLRHLPGTVVDMQTMKRIVAYQKTISGGKEFKVLVDMRGRSYLSEGAASLVAHNPNAGLLRAVAIVTDEGPGLEKVNDFIKHGRPNVETRAFTGEAEAREWLQSK